MTGAPRWRWTIGDLMPGAVSGAPGGYPQTRKELERALDTLVRRELVGREAFTSISPGDRVGKPGSRRLTYVYWLPQLPPSPSASLRVWFACNPWDTNQTYTLTRPMMVGRVDSTVESLHLDVTVLTPNGHGIVTPRYLTGRLSGACSGLLRALKGLPEPVVLVASIRRTKTPAPQSDEDRMPAGLVPPRSRSVAGVLSPIGMDPKTARKSRPRALPTSE